MKKVYELRKAFKLQGTWQRSSYHGTFYATLDAAQAQVPETWTKRDRQRAWDTARGDMVFERKVIT